MWFKQLLAIFLIITLVPCIAISEWFWNEHYYEVKYLSQVIHAKGKPKIDGDFTIFIKWPENLEWRIKTKDVRLIKDIGPLSPDEIKKEKLESIIKDALKMNNNSFTTEKLRLARSEGYSDNDIWEYWIKVNHQVAQARIDGITLDILAEAWEKIESSQIK
jgi:hypothetical protein